jgi:hypothetical protein
MIAKEVLNNIRNSKNAKPSEFLLDKSKGAVGSAFIGAGVGLVIGYSRKYNLFFSALIGSLAGAFIHKMFIKKEENK